MLEPLTDELPKVRQAPADCAENILGLVRSLCVPMLLFVTPFLNFKQDKRGSFDASKGGSLDGDVSDDDECDEDSIEIRELVKNISKSLNTTAASTSTSSPH